MAATITSCLTQEKSAKRLKSIPDNQGRCLPPVYLGGKIRLYSAMLLHRIGIDERFDDSKLGNFKLSGTCPVGAKRNSRRD